MSVVISKRGKSLKILYVHGYGGSANGSTSQLIAKYRASDSVYAPAIDYRNPEKSVKEIAEYVRSYNPDVIMASSLGGYYVLQLNVGIPRLVINPALPKDLEKIDNDSEFINALESQLDRLEDKSRDMVYVFCGDNDDVAPNCKYFMKRYANNAAYVVEHGDMGHNVSEECMKNEINSMLNRIEFGLKNIGSDKERTAYNNGH